VKIISTNDAKAFFEKTQQILEKDEINGSLINGIIKKVISNKNAYGDKEPWFFIGYNEEEISVLAIMTPPYKMLIYGNFEKDVINGLIVEIDSKNIFIPGITGENKITEYFVMEWIRKHNCRYKVDTNLRLFILQNVNNYTKPTGIFRKGELSELDTIYPLRKYFSIECNEPVNDTIIYESLKNSIKQEEVYVWEDGSIVAMAVKTRPTENGMTVGGVYTLKEHRQKGYATALVSELSQNILNFGKKFCILYTDLSNPTSNSIYQKIGYKPVVDSISYSFN